MFKRTSTSDPIACIPESAPFTAEQRAWLNGFIAGLFAAPAPGAAPATAAERPPAVPTEPLLVLFGSQTGTAEGLARRVAEEAGRRGFTPRVTAMNECDRESLAQTGKAVLISSTWGDGDPPDNAASFWSWLNADTAPRLEQLQFAVLGLGDRNYANFCGASKKIDARLEALGARRLVPLGECDVDYEAAAAGWEAGLWNKLGSRGANGANGSPLSGPKPAATNGANGKSTAGYGRQNPFPSRLLNNVLLNKPGSAKEVRHYELSLEGSGLVYEVGDALGVMPANCPVLVDDVLAGARCRGEEKVSLGGDEMPLREALARHLDITRPSRELLGAVAKAAPAVEFVPLLAPERAEDLRRWLTGRDVLDVLAQSPAPLPIDELVPCLRKLTPRLYSIASSPKAHPSQAHLTVSAVRYENLGRGRKGVASTFLADRVGDADYVKVFVQPSSTFRLPKEGSTPIIMVGPGTGVAPFRAFLEERQATGATGKNWLFFGDQCRATDFLYETELTRWAEDGFLTRLGLAFSRDQAAKIYVQDRMLEYAAELWDWLEEGAHFYVCGDAARMARDVDRALHGVIEQAGGRSADQAGAYVEQMKSGKRYLRDVY